MRKQTTIIANTQYYLNRTPSSVSLSPLKVTNIIKQKQPSQPKVPNNSMKPQIQPLNISTNNSVLSNNQMNADGMSKIISMMREQIETSSNFYVNKMKKLLQDQAKQICALRDCIVQNQRDLIRKTAIIDQLRNNSQKQRQTTPKKKLSVLSSQPQQITNQSTQQLSQKITQLQMKLAGLQQTIQQRNHSQKKMNKKVEQIQKGTIKYFASKIAGCQNKLDKYLIKKQNQIQKIYGDLNIYIKVGEDNGIFINKNTGTNLSKTQNISQPYQPNNILSNTTIKKQSPTSIFLSNITNKQIKILNQIQQLRGELAHMKTKQHKYDNHQVQILKNNINKINKYLESHRCSVDSNSKDNTQIREIYSEKNIRNNGQPNNNHLDYNIINLAKSQKLIGPQHPNLSIIPPQKFANINTLNPTTNRPNLYPPPPIVSQSVIQNMQKVPENNQNIQSSKNINISYHTNNNQCNQINTLNLSTPTIYYHDKITNLTNNSNKNISGEYIKNYSSNNPNINNSTKTVVKSANMAQTSVTTYMNDHSHTNKYKNNNLNINNNKHVNLFKPFQDQPLKSNRLPKNQTSQQKILQNQFFDDEDQDYLPFSDKQQEVSYHQSDQQSIQYLEQQSSYHQYEKQPSYVRISNIDRLINTIKQHKMTMPVFVEIDQTGYLKCIMNGMYLVDSNDDGFELLDGQIKQLTQKQIIKLANTSNYGAVSSYNRELR